MSRRAPTVRDFLAGRGRLEEGLREMQLAHELDPLSPIVAAETGWVLASMRRGDEALAHIEQLVRADPGFSAVRSVAGGTPGMSACWRSWAPADGDSWPDRRPGRWNGVSVGSLWRQRSIRQEYAAVPCNLFQVPPNAAHASLRSIVSYPRQGVTANPIRPSL